jgi:hypothetical protein
VAICSGTCQGKASVFHHMFSLAIMMYQCAHGFHVYMLITCAMSQNFKIPYIYVNLYFNFNLNLNK